MKQVSIRTYNEKDRDAVFNLLRWNTPQYFAPSEKNDLVDYLANHLEQYFVLELEGEVIGCGGINFSKDLKTGKISWNILHPEQQGRGYGKLLLQHRIDNLKATPSVKDITVRTSQHTYLFYEKCGFTLQSATKDYWAKGFDLYCMKYDG